MSALAYMAKHPEDFSTDPQERERQLEYLIKYNEPEVYAKQTEATVTKFEETHRPLTPDEIEHNRDLPTVPAGRYRPLIDPASIHDRGKHDRDLAECFVLADQHTRPPGESAIHGGISGAIVGAGLSALLSWILGGNPGIGAASGAVIGGVGSAGAAAQASGLTFEMIYRNCMIGRGWHVLR